MIFCHCVRGWQLFFLRGCAWAEGVHVPNEKYPSLAAPQRGDAPPPLPPAAFVGSRRYVSALLRARGGLLTKRQFSLAWWILFAFFLFTCSLKAFFLSSFYLIWFLSLFIWSLSCKNWSGFWPPGSLPLLLQYSVWDWSNSESDAISASIIQMMLLTWNLPWPAAVALQLLMLCKSLCFAQEALHFPILQAGSGSSWKVCQTHL